MRDINRLDKFYDELKAQMSVVSEIIDYIEQETGIAVRTTY